MIVNTNEVTTLDLLSPGECATVIDNNLNEENIKRRLEDIGLTANSEIKCLHVSPLGDPKAYKICCTVIAIRKNHSSQILVRKMSDGDPNGTHK